MVKSRRRHSQESLNVAVVLVRFGNAKYRDTHRVFDRLLRQWEWQPKRKIIVENDQTLELQCPGGGWEIEHGDNTCAEFSGIEHCLVANPCLTREFDGIVFVTSAFLMDFNRYLRYFTRDALAFAIREQAFLGHFDQYPDYVALMGKQSKRWMRTACFFAPKRGLEQLEIWSIKDPSPFFSGRSDEPFTPNAPLSKRYQEYLVDWLTGEGISGHKWHSSFTLSEETLDHFQFKSMRIMNEHNLAMQARSSNIPIVDVQALRNIQRRNCNTSLPSEESQIRFRNYRFTSPRDLYFQLLLKIPR